MRCGWCFAHSRAPGAGRGCALPAGRGLPAVAKQLICRHESKSVVGAASVFDIDRNCFSIVRASRRAELQRQTVERMAADIKIGQTSAGERVEEADAKEAIRQMGTNAIPTLLHILGATDRNKWWVLSRLKSRGFREMYHNQNVPTDDLQDTGVEAFGLLGTNAIPAIPKINKLFGDWETCSPAARVLAGLGPEGVAALTNGLASKTDVIRGVTLWAIGEKSSMDFQHRRPDYDCLP